MEATRNALVSDMGPEIKSKLLGLKKALQELQRTSFYSRHIAKVQIYPLKQPEVHHQMPV